MRCRQAPRTSPVPGPMLPPASHASIDSAGPWGFQPVSGGTISKIIRDEGHGGPIDLRFMALTAVPGGAVRVPFCAPLNALTAARPSGWWGLAAKCVAIAAGQLRDGLLRVEGPPRDGRSAEPGAPSRPDPSNAPGAPLPVIVVRRQRGGEALPLPPRSRRRRGFGEDPLEEKRAPNAVRRAIDDILGGIEDRRDEDRS